MNARSASSPGKKRADAPSTFTYHLLRAALETFRKNLVDLDNIERARVAYKATQTFEIEDLVLASSEAAKVVITVDQIDRAIAQVRSRYTTEQEFEDDLANNGLNRQSLGSALHRELTFDAVMQGLGSQHASVNEIDIALFFELQRDRFQPPEKRVARHILITVNDDFIENRRNTAQARAEQLAERLRGNAHRFASMARKFSECPTAAEDGKLGCLVRGQLYPELDRVLFRLDENEISGIVESELGFHILWCERIEKTPQVSLHQVKDKIRSFLEKRKRRNCQKAWLAELKKNSAPAS